MYKFRVFTKEYGVVNVHGENLEGVLESYMAAIRESGFPISMRTWQVDTEKGEIYSPVYALHGNVSKQLPTLERVIK